MYTEATYALLSDALVRPFISLSFFLSFCVWECRRGKDTRRRPARNCISPTALRYETCHPGLPQAGRTVIEPLLRGCHFWWYGGFCVSISSCTTGNGANSHARCSQIFPPRSLALFSIPLLSPLPPHVPPLRCLSSARPFILCLRLATSRARCRRLFPSHVTAVIARGTFQPPVTDLSRHYFSL